jgi:DNA polymerase III delta subunit
MYVVYKIFVLENDVYILNDRINKIEIEYGMSSVATQPRTNVIYPQNTEEIDMSDILMNEIFNDKIDIIDIDKMEEEVPEKEQEVIFDLKKEVINDDKESIISSNTHTKKKLLKLNLDKLKEKCEHLELPTDGTKAQLIDRILEKENL